MAFCLLVCDWFYWGRTTDHSANRCQMHGDSILFKWEYVQCNNAAITAPYNENFISKLTLNCFKDPKRVQGLAVFK